MPKRHGRARALLAPPLVVTAALATEVARADPPSPPPDPAPTTAPPPARKPARDPKPDEIHVQGHRREVGGAAMSREEAREIPGAFGDPARFVEAMPGVVPTTSGLQAFYVRGAPPETTGFYIDGVPVPALYHIGFGPSVVHPGLVDRAELFAGAAPAYFGRAIGATIEEETTGPATRLHGEANLRLLDTSAFVEGPFGDGRGSAEASGRYGYPGIIVPLFASGVGLTYWDYQARASWNLSDRDRIGLFVFGSNDVLTQVETNTANIPYTAQLVKTEFHRADLRYDHALRGGSTLRVAGTLGADTGGDELNEVHSLSARLRAELDVRASKTVRIRAGADVQWTDYSLGDSPKQPADPTPSANPTVVPRTDVVPGAYADVSWRISRHVELVPGVRADVFTTRATGQSTTAVTPTIDPRLAARVTLFPRVTAISTVGVAHQLPGFAVVEPDATPYLAPGAESGVQGAQQLSEGIEVALPEGFVASATGFLHHYTGLPDLTAPCVGNPCVAQPVDGQAYGLELLVRRPLTERFALLASYTLSRSTRQAHSEPGQPVLWIPSEYDRTHVGSLIASYDLGRRWRVGARFYGYTGRPYSHSYEDTPVPPFNTLRFPGFWRLDFRLEKAWTVGERGRLAFVVEGMNVTLNKETVDVSCTPRRDQYDVCTLQTLGPITMPSIGLEGAF